MGCCQVTAPMIPEDGDETDILGKIRDRLARHPEVPTEEGPGWIRCLPVSAQGFVVEISADDGGYLVSFDGWHERFRSARAAGDRFFLGLSDACRLEVAARDGKPYKWTVETLRGGVWEPIGATARLLTPFWRQATVSYRRNGVLPSV